MEKYECLKFDGLGTRVLNRFPGHVVRLTSTKGLQELVMLPPLKRQLLLNSASLPFSPTAASTEAAYALYR